MKRVFLVQHLHKLPNGAEDLKTIGVYSSMDAAVAAVDRLKSRSRFCDHANVVNSEMDEDTQGFYIDEYGLDSDHWQEGFITV